jgi:glutamyl-tRNA synthetase
VTQVVRGADLLDSTPRQVWLARALGVMEPCYAHVPLVLGPDGTRLAKRHGAVTLRDVGVAEARRWIASSLGLRDDLSDFDPARLPREPTVYEPAG